MKSGAIIFDEYMNIEPEEQFNFLYSHFSVMKNMLVDYKDELVDEVMEQKACNRRSDDGELGVRVKISVGISDPTANKAINHSMIEKAIIEGVLDEAFFEDTDNQEELIRKVTCYHTISKDLRTFSNKLAAMEQNDQRVLIPYLMGQKTMSELAEEMGIEYRSAVTHVYRVKKKLSERVKPKLCVAKRG